MNEAVQIYTWLTSSRRSLIACSEEDVDEAFEFWSGSEEAVSTMGSPAAFDTFLRRVARRPLTATADFLASAAVVD